MTTPDTPMTMKRAATDGKIVALRFVLGPGGTRALRLALKLLLRRFGVRCVSIEVKAEEGHKK